LGVRCRFGKVYEERAPDSDTAMALDRSPKSKTGRGKGVVLGKGESGGGELKK